MAEDLARLTVYIDARLNQYENAMKKAQATAHITTRKVEESARNMENKLSAAFSRSSYASNSLMASLQTLAPAIAPVFTVDGLIRFADQMTRITNSLKIAGYEGESLKSTMDGLYAIAQRQAAPLEATTSLFSRLSQVKKELKADSSELMSFTEGVTMALRVQGSSATQASGALLQLSQAMASGTVRAEEFNSINEGALPILKTVASGLKEAGGSVGQLRQLVIEGKVSSEAFFRAFLAGMPQLSEQSSKSAMTVGQSFEKMKNSILATVGGIDDATSASSNFAKSISDISDSIDRLGKKTADYLKEMTAVGATGNLFIDNATSASEFLKNKNSNTGSSKKNPSGEVVVPIKRRTPTYFNDVSNFVAPRPVRPVSLDDFKPPKLLDNGNGNGGGNGGSLSSPSSLDRQIESIQRRSREIENETAVIGRSSYETEKARVAFDLLEAAKESNVKVTPELQAKINMLATSYASAKQNVEQMTAAQESMKQLGQELGQSMTSFFSDMVSGGKNAEDAVMNLTKRLADMAFQAAFMGTGPMAALFGTSSSGGIFGSLISSFPGFANGTNSAPGGLAMVGERGPELVNLPRGSQVIPNIDTRKMMQGGGSAPIIVHQTFTADSSPRELAQVAASIKADTLAAFTEMVGRGAMNARR